MAELVDALVSEAGGETRASSSLVDRTKKEKNMAKSFQSLPRLVQFILLLIPGVNWIVEILVRVSAVFEKASLRNIIGLILGVFLGFVFGWVDLIWVLLFKHLVFCKA